MIKFGGIETAGTFGGWSLVDSNSGGLPQDVASGVYVAFENRTEKVTPIYYFGYQLVNGMNHCLVCRRERTQGEKIIKDYVTVVINIPPKVDGYKEAKLVTMEVVEETILSYEAKKAFDEKVATLTGTTHKPLLEVGRQIAKGVNYVIMAGLDFKNQLRKLRDADGNQLYVEGVGQKQLYSLPIEFNRTNSWDSTKAHAIAGEWKYSVVGIREQLEYEVLREATLQNVSMADGKPLSLAENDMVTIKVKMRLGFTVVQPNAFALLTPKP